MATDLRLVSVILGHSAAWSLRRPCELLHRAFQLTSVSWLLPKVHITGIELLLSFFHVYVEINVAECKMISPSVLKVFSLATSAMASKATSER